MREDHALNYTKFVMFIISAPINMQLHIYRILYLLRIKLVLFCMFKSNLFEKVETEPEPQFLVIKGACRHSRLRIFTQFKLLEKLNHSHYFTN